MFETAAQIFSASSVAGSRSSLTLFMLGLAMRLQIMPSSEGTWIASNVGLAVLLTMVVIEEFFEQDEDLQQLLAILNYGIRGTGGAVAAWAIAQSGADMPPWVAVVGGAVVAAGTHHLRMRVYDQMQGFGEGIVSPRTWLSWLELGGAIGIIVAVLLAPFIAIAFVVLAAIVAGVVLLVRRGADKMINYRPCPACGQAARMEAHRCPHCRANIPITRWLMRGARP